MKRWQKLMITSGLCVGLLGMPAVVAPSATAVQALSPFEALASGAVAMVYVSKQLNKMDSSTEGQNQSLESTKAKTGYYDNVAYQERAQRILASLEQSKLVKRKPYRVYVNPDTDFNAFMTIGRVMSVNKGTMDALDDDSLAYVMSHELGHGEHKDVIDGLKKSVGVSTAISVATAGAGDASVLLGNIVGNYLDNQVFTMSQEKNADEFGFKLFTDAGYNPGAAAVAMAVIKQKYGDLYNDGFTQVVAPNNHPKTSNRITDNLTRLYEYSGKVVSVDGATVYIKKKPVYTGTAAGMYTAEMRAYLVAGKLAKWYHDKANGQARAVSNTVVMNGVTLVTLPTNADSLRMAEAINSIS